MVYLLPININIEPSNSKQAKNTVSEKYFPPFASFNMIKL